MKNKMSKKQKNEWENALRIVKIQSAKIGGVVINEDLLNDFIRQLVKEVTGEVDNHLWENEEAEKEQKNWEKEFGILWAKSFESEKDLKIMLKFINSLLSTQKEDFLRRLPDCRKCTYGDEWKNHDELSKQHFFEV